MKFVASSQFATILQSISEKAIFRRLNIADFPRLTYTDLAESAGADGRCMNQHQRIHSIIRSVKQIYVCQ